MRLKKHYISQNTINIIFIPICILLIWLSFAHKSESGYQLLLALIAAVLYIVLSTIHHFFDKSLTFENSFEYILVGVLAFLAVLLFVM